jgi:hypothetical protein
MQKLPTKFQIKLNSKEARPVSEFWSWAYSDILSNRNRGIFAEYIVGCALDQIDKPRVEWDAYDFEYKGKKIEVKCSAYLQNWNQDKPSEIKWDIAKKKSWYAETNTYSKEVTRSSDCYVFCLYKEKNKSLTDNIIDLGNWCFYVIATSEIDRIFINQKSVTKNRLEKEGVVSVGFDELKEKINFMIGSILKT